MPAFEMTEGDAIDLERALNNVAALRRLVARGQRHLIGALRMAAKRARAIEARYQQR